MKKVKLIQNVLLFLICLNKVVDAQENNIRFRQISPPGGFTLDAINTIIQDDLGYIWMGTKQGLIKYNSENTDWFIPTIDDSLSLPDEMINDILCDTDNQLWVATNRGLCKFDRSKQIFNRIEYRYENESKSDSVVRSILKIEDDRLFVSDRANVGYLDFKTNRLVRIGKGQIKSPTVLNQDNFNRTWIGTSRGEVFRYFPSDNSVQKIISTTGRVSSIYSENDQIWIGTDGDGAKLYRLDGELIKEVSFDKTSGNKNSGHVRVITKDTYGRLWFGTYEGLYMDDEKKLTNFKPDNYPRLPHNSIYDIYEDKQGTLWIGTWSGGVALIHHSDNNFRTYRHNVSRNSISNNMVSSFLQVATDELLIGTEVGGLNSFNPNTEKFKLIQLTDNQEITNIKSLCKDKQGGIWVGTHWQGLWYRQAGSTKFKLFGEGPEDGKHISSSGVFSLCAVDSGVWIGTFLKGINFYSFETKSIRYCFQNNSDSLPMSNLTARSILADSNSNLWIGTTLDFVYKVHVPSGKITKIANEQFASDYKNIDAYHLWEHSSGRIWIGTKGKGVLILHPDSNKIEEFDADGLLEGKSVYGIIEDKNQNVWITSNDGLILYNPEDNSKRHFAYSDGIQSDLFMPQSVYTDEKGDLYFGGTNGFTRIKPTEIKLNSRKPFTTINEISTTKNKSIHPIYTNNLEIEPIKLSPKETTLRINFSADNYLLSEKNKFKYRLVNYYDEWVDNKNEGSVLFTNLSAGEYIFEVKACNNDGIWSDSPTRMTIIIDKFWYKTSVAYFIYFSLFALFSYFIGRFYFDRLQLKRAILIEKTQRESEEQIHEMKLKFFTNISHEFRTPLTLISWPLKRLLEADNITDEQREEIEVANRNSNRLLQLINQIIDLRKIEKEKSKLNISKINIISFVNELQKDFSMVAKSREINFSIESPYDSLEIEADLEKVDAILYNLLSNAYKYVPEKGKITITINKKITNTNKSYSNQLSYGEILVDDFIEIAIEDTGMGIDNEDLNKIFTRFEQGKQSNIKNLDQVKRGGIGLAMCKDFTLLHHGKIMVQSELNEGSRFTVLLPTKQKAQKVLFESHQEIRNLNTEENSTIQTISHKDHEKKSQLLIVEDNADFRKLITKCLSKFHQILTASNGNEALQILKKHNIDLVVSDVMMPEMDGFELCSIIKTQLETSHIPVVLITALSSSENLIAGLDKGADAYLTKPFNETVLIKQIENILQLRTKIKENFSKQFISHKTIEVSSIDNFFLNRVQKVVLKNIADENFSIDSLAEELMISRSQLHRKIKSLSGETTSEFVNLIRIKKAVELLGSGQYRFNEVAYQVGFSSQSYFNRCFKKVYNTTPKEYIETQQKKIG